MIRSLKYVGVTRGEHGWDIRLKPATVYFLFLLTAEGAGADYVGLRKMYLIIAHRQPSSNCKLVWECFERLNTLGSSNKVWILSVPGHVGLEGNAAADELAKKGIGTILHGPEPFCGIGNGFMAMTLQNEERSLRELYWAGLPGMEQCRVLIEGYEPMLTKDCLNLTKNNLRIIVGILTDHCRLNYHLGKLGIPTGTACRLCAERDETSIDVLEQFPALVQSRSRHLGGHLIPDAKLKDLEVGNILKFLTVTGLFEIL